MSPVSESPESPRLHHRQPSLQGADVTCPLKRSAWFNGSSFLRFLIGDPTKPSHIITDHHVPRPDRRFQKETTVHFRLARIQPTIPRRVKKAQLRIPLAVLFSAVDDHMLKGCWNNSRRWNGCSHSIYFHVHRYRRRWFCRCFGSVVYYCEKAWRLYWERWPRARAAPRAGIERLAAGGSAYFASRCQWAWDWICTFFRRWVDRCRESLVARSYVVWPILQCVDERALIYSKFSYYLGESRRERG